MPRGCAVVGCGTCCTCGWSAGCVGMMPERWTRQITLSWSPCRRVLWWQLISRSLVGGVPGSLVGDVSVAPGRLAVPLPLRHRDRTVVRLRGELTSSRAPRVRRKLLRVFLGFPVGSRPRQGHLPRPGGARCCRLPQPSGAGPEHAPPSPMPRPTARVFFARWAYSASWTHHFCPPRNFATRQEPGDVIPKRSLLFAAFHPAGACGPGSYHLLRRLYPCPCGA